MEYKFKTFHSTQRGILSLPACLPSKNQQTQLPWGGKNCTQAFRLNGGREGVERGEKREKERGKEKEKE